MKSKLFLGILLAILIIATGLMTARRSVKGSNDYDTFYQAGQAVLKQQGIYYTGEFYQVDKKNSPFLYPPFAACFFAPWAMIPLKASAFLWNFVNIFLFGLSLGLIFKILNAQFKDLPGTIRKAPVQSFALLFFCIATFFDNLTMAQMNIVVFAACLGGIYLARNKKEFAGGMLFAFAICLKVTPVFFVLYFILKRSWKVLAGILLGGLLMTLVIPGIVFGLQNNVLYHRQFLGRTIKPPFVGLMANFKPEIQHPLKKSAEMFAHNHRGAMLLDKNQSLEAGLTRLLLKDRKRFGYEPQPIYVARRYEKMPVLFGGIPHTILPWVIRGIQLALLGGIMWICLNPKLTGKFYPFYGIALFFQSMTLFAPWVRSHQFVSWIFSLLLLYLIPIQNPKTNSRAAFYSVLAVLFYAAQALPYGKAAAMGMIANCILTLGIAHSVLSEHDQQTPDLSNAN